MKRLLKSVLIVILCFVGAATAVPTAVDERNIYTTSFNSMASSLMNWYGSLIAENKDKTFEKTESKWDSYRSQYPENITQIKIVSTEMTKLDVANKYQFIVTVQLNTTDKNDNQIVTEHFIFDVPHLKQAIIEDVVRDGQQATEQLLGEEWGIRHYQTRKFAYAWLAYLDGVTEMPAMINIDKWRDKAKYSIKIANINEQGSVATIIEKRKQYLTKGGHLLRSVDIKEVDGAPNNFILDLIIEWKGTNQAGKPVIAKIHQQIEYQIHTNLWNVVSIKETHLLPDIAPWMGFLC